VSKSKPDLVLASTSSHRRALLERFGLPFRCRAPCCDEVALQGVDPDPSELAERLAYAKAASVFALEPDSVVIGCDQVISLGGRILSKPGTPARAIDQLAEMAGRTHQVITALVVLAKGRVVRVTSTSTLRMRRLSREAIKRYVDADQPLDCAGSYKIESRGIVLFNRINTDDHTAITGLPTIALVTILRELGFEMP
jgi:septum formation protein